MGPDVRIGVFAAVRMLLCEIGAVALVLCVLLPFTRKLVARRRGAVSMQAHLPVIFIHGYMSRRGIFAPMLGYLRSRGLSTLFTMHIRPRHGEMDDFARQLVACVDRVCNTTGSSKVILVGYSMGGLVARAYVERWGGASKVAKVITVGTPHHGTGIARVVVGTNGREMRVRSEWLRELNRDENLPEGPAYVSIYSAHDNMLYPQTSAELGKAKNIRLMAMGHFTMILSREVGHLVHREVVNA
ncbi:MAG: alpha/beta fold hydrolase [bacterium]|nr:alpha/beta fold hydrolase [bacterium]